MESPLEVLSRAATMVQDNANESRLTTKELPTTKWRRDRRLRNNEYHYSGSSSPPPTSAVPQQPQNGNTNAVNPHEESMTNATGSAESPIDMSVSSTTGKPRSPPPPYREPLPGSTFVTGLARPSVITQAPKRDNQFGHLNGENDNDCTESISMCDPVIDEHFRRSLGADYMALFEKKATQTTKPEKVISPKTTITVSNDDSIATSVDDHFAKALGDTWKKLQADKEQKPFDGDN